MTPAPKKLLLRALQGERTERPPIWLMRQAGRYLPEYNQVRDAAGGMLRLCTSPEHAAEVTLQPLRRFPLDGAILFADLPQVAHALRSSASSTSPCSAQPRGAGRKRNRILTCSSTTKGKRGKSVCLIWWT